MTSRGEAPVLIVAGPTASGKSALALAVAREFDGVVINADSMQVYRELRILTARPDPKAEARVPHRLYGVLSVRDTCSAARWRDMAVAEITSAHNAGRLPVICGGTGLYLRALTGGLSPIPEIPDPVRKSIRGRFARDGLRSSFAALEAVDPVTAARLSRGDSQRITRALEVYEATGRPLSEWQAIPAAGPPPELRFATILLQPPRAELYAACDARLEAMIAEGVLAEVAALRRSEIDPALPAMKALGVPDFLRHLAGEITLDEAIAAAQQATRRYAKRQSTWFANQIIAEVSFPTKYSEKLSDKIFSFIRQNLLTPAT
ncbi:MAG: tRNA (adenosine(37)-N6)-dimethylallyltransferase MiaA [Alphaproteobacteria bacterium]